MGGCNQSAWDYLDNEKQKAALIAWGYFWGYIQKLKI
jgi:hypothetical protein